MAVVANFPLPRGAHAERFVDRRKLAASEAAVVVSETLVETDLPVERLRVDARDRRRSIDRFFRRSGRASVLHLRFGSAPPPPRLVRTPNGILASLEVERREQPLQPAPDPAPAAAFAPVRLFPAPFQVLNQCRLAQARARFPILCPTLLPRATLGWARGELPVEPTAERLPHPRTGARRFAGVTVGYGGAGGADELARLAEAPLA